MTDETSRSAPGNPPDQRHSQAAPAWWAALGRADLPDDEAAGRPLAALQQPPRLPRIATLRTTAKPGQRRRSMDRTRSLLLTLLAVVVAALVAWVGVGGGSARSMVVCLIIFGVPTGLAALVATVVIKRGS